MMIIGISGGRGAGKSTLCRKLAEILPNSLLIIVDNYMHEISGKQEKKIFNKLGIEKNPQICSYNYFFKDFESVKIWISAIENEVTHCIETEIEKNKDKDYIIVDWCFLPLCEFFYKCDCKISVTGDYEKREKRLTKRLINKDNFEHDRNDTPLSSYTPEMYLNSIKYTELSNMGYKFNYSVKNNSNIEDFYDKINKLANDLM